MDGKRLVAYCVQYRESDFAFVSRLMEEEGIYYYFEHSVQGHRMIVTNRRQQYPEMPGRATVWFDEVQGSERDECRVTAFDKVQEMRACKTSLWDYSFELPGKNLENNPQRIQESVKVGEKITHRLDHDVAVNGVKMLEVQDYPGGYAKRFDRIDKNGNEIPDDEESRKRPDSPQNVFRDKDRSARFRPKNRGLTSSARLEVQHAIVANVGVQGTAAPGTA